jgi:hypothetical protein
MQHPVVVVLDINGVLGEVAKKDANAGGVLLPSRQRFFMNTATPYFLENLISHGYLLVLWTSRLSKNAKPIEDLPQIKNTPFVLKLHGENCKRRVKYHPVKSVSNLREKLPSNLQDAEIIFVDDSPEYVTTDDRSRVIACETYRAKQDTYQNLQDILHILAAE